MVEEKNKKGLGRGLMSLFGDEASEQPSTDTHKAAYLSISISDLVQNQFQPRSYFDEKKIEELWLDDLTSFEKEYDKYYTKRIKDLS